MTDRNEPPDIQDLVDNTWDACDEIFDVKFHNKNKFRSSIKDYFDFLKESFIEVIGRDNIGGVLITDKIDRLLLHYASQRIYRDHWDSWSRLNFDLTQFQEDKRNYLDKVNYYDAGIPIKQHVFQKAKGNQTLCFEFVAGPAEEQEDYSYLKIPKEACDILLHCLYDFGNQRTSSHQLEVAKYIYEKLETLEKNEGENSGFLNALKQTCNANLSGDLSQPEQIKFLIESSLITLTLLKRKTYTLPRSFLLVPVFAGSIGLGGIAFFSKKSRFLRDNRRILKHMARNLLAHVGIMESREIEFDKRRLEATSPIIHLFVHSFNKAFTTPILNICDELKGASGMLINPPVESAGKRDAKKLGYRLDAIETFLRSYTKRFSGTFAALASQPSIENGSVRFFKLQDFDGKLINNEIIQQVKSLYAVLLANDVFDCTDFASYQPYLSYMDGLEKLVDLRIKLDHRIPGQRDVFMLHLVGLIQNSIEALPLEKVLRSFKESPSLLSSPFWIRVSSREEHDNIILEVLDNGTGFDDDKCKALNNYLEEFSSTDHFPPTVTEIRWRQELEHSTLSTKSGSALGQGILGFAEYLSCICRVEGLTGQGYPSDDAKILMRGSIKVNPEPLKTGTKSMVQIRLPNLSRPKPNQGVFLEQRD